MYLVNFINKSAGGKACDIEVAFSYAETKRHYIHKVVQLNAESMEKALSILFGISLDSIIIES